MLESLHIRNFVLINSLDIDFPEGLIIISGPTGAGKSVLIGALGLLLGRKADASAISGDAENCVVEGEFFLDNASLRQFALENDLEYENGHFTVRRTVARSGRSRAFINDCPVTMPVLEEFGSLMVDIHSQHDTRLLTSKQYQRSILDSYAGVADLLVECRAVYDNRKRLSSEIDALKAKISKALAEADYNRSVFEQLSSANLFEGELEQLEEEQNRLANAEQIKELVESSAALFDGGEDGLGVNASLIHVHKSLDKLSSYLKGFDALAQRLEYARLELKDISEEIESVNDSLSADPERLQQIDDRLSLIYGLMKRHSVNSEAELILKRESLRTLVEDTDSLDTQLLDLEKEYASSDAEYQRISGLLHDKRSAAIADFCKCVCEYLSFMELDKARFEIALDSCTPGPDGVDEVSFLFNAAGGAAVPMAKCASGGELSRIMLSLKRVMSAYMSMPVMVFDEIDTGVSGSVADKMGSVICDMGANIQVFAITHLPQVAAKGQAHYVVEKTIAEGKAESTIKKLSAEQRVMEIARMLSGASLTPAAIENARTLLS